MKTKGLREGLHREQSDSSQPLALQVPECQQPDLHCPGRRGENLPLEKLNCPSEKDLQTLT